MDAVGQSIGSSFIHCLSYVEMADASHHHHLVVVVASYHHNLLEDASSDFLPASLDVVNYYNMDQLHTNHAKLINFNHHELPFH